MNGIEKSINGGSVLSIIDFSDESMKALSWASHVASNSHSHLTIVYPYRLHELPRTADVSKVKRTMDSEAVHSFKTLGEPIVRKDEVTYDFRPEVGFVSDRVYSYSSKNDIRMIVISRKTAVTSLEMLNDLLAIIPVPLVIVP